MKICQNITAEPYEQPAAQVPDTEYLMLVSAENKDVADAMLASAPSKEQIFRLQQAMIPIQCEMPEAEHFFAPGMYGRRFAMPAGMLVVGKIHKHAHLMMVLKGRASVLTEFGREEVSAGYVSVSQPGAKRIVLAYEDTVFMTVHTNQTDTQDLLEIESQHIIPESCYLDEDKIKELLS